MASYHSAVDFDVLGPVRVLREGDPVQLKGPKQRAVLAVLIAHAGRPTSPDELIDAVWGEEPPPAARATLQSHISRIRTELGDVVVFEGGGYRLAVDRDRIDSERFEEGVERARTLADSQPAEAAKLLGEVLALWRGHPYADVPGVRGAADRGAPARGAAAAGGGGPHRGRAGAGTARRGAPRARGPHHREPAGRGLSVAAHGRPLSSGTAGRGAARLPEDPGVPRRGDGHRPFPSAAGSGAAHPGTRPVARPRRGAQGADARLLHDRR